MSPRIYLGVDRYFEELKKDVIEKGPEETSQDKIETGRSIEFGPEDTAYLSRDILDAPEDVINLWYQDRDRAMEIGITEDEVRELELVNEIEKTEDDLKEDK